MKPTPEQKKKALLKIMQSVQKIETEDSNLLSDPKDKLIKEIKDAAEEMKLILSGKKIARNVDDFLKEL